MEILENFPERESWTIKNTWYFTMIWNGLDVGTYKTLAGGIHVKGPIGRLD